MNKNQLITLFITFAGMILFAGCSDNDDKMKTMPQVETVTPVPPPVEDTKAVTSSLKTYVFPHQYTEVSSALCSRMTNLATSLDETVKTVILHAADIASLTEQNYKGILTVFAGNGTLVVVMPTIEQWNLFVEKLATTADQLIEAQALPVFISDETMTALNAFKQGKNDENDTYYVYDGDEKHTNEHFCDMVALRGNDVYYLDDLIDVDDTRQTTTITSVDDDGNKSSEVVDQEITMEYTDYEYGLHADEITRWINLQPEHQQKVARMMSQGRSLLAGSTRGGMADLTELMSAQTQYYQFAVRTNDIFVSVASATVIYDVWTAHDLDRHDDYYFIHQQVNSRNSGLRCGPENKKEWFDRQRGNKKWSAYGGYLSKLVSENYLDGANANNKQLRKYSPTTSVGSSTFSTSVGWNLGGNVGLGIEGLSGGLSSGVSFEKSYSTDIQDLSVSVNTDNSNSPVWTYSGPSVQLHSGFYFTHDIAKNVQQNDCHVENVWIWTIPNASGTYTLQSYVNVNTEILCFRTKGFWKAVEHLNLDNRQHYSFNLNPPARYLQKWQMSCIATGGVDQGKDIDAFLKDRYPDYFVPSLKIYTAVDNKQAADACFAKFISVLKYDQEIWRDKGHRGTYQFKFKQEGTSSIYKTYDFQVY